MEKHHDPSNVAQRLIMQNYCQRLLHLNQSECVRNKRNLQCVSKREHDETTTSFTLVQKLLVMSLSYILHKKYCDKIPSPHSVDVILHSRRKNTRNSIFFTQNNTVINIMNIPYLLFEPKMLLKPRCRYYGFMIFYQHIFE